MQVLNTPERAALTACSPPDCPPLLIKRCNIQAIPYRTERWTRNCNVRPREPATHEGNSGGVAVSDSERRYDGQLEPTGKETDSSPLRVSLTVADRETLLEMMAALDERDVPVRTEDIFRLSMDEADTATLDLQKLTDKQRETLEIALRTGYYEQPRNADLADLAGEIGVSKSAVSQRLRSAEAKIIKNAFGEFR